VPISRLLFELRLVFQFVIFFIGGLSGPVWSSVLWLCLFWLSLVFHEVAILPTVLTGSSWCPVSSSRPIRSHWPITGAASKAVALCGVKIYRFGGRNIVLVSVGVNVLRGCRCVSFRVPRSPRLYTLLSASMAAVAQVNSLSVRTPFIVIYRRTSKCSPLQKRLTYTLSA
jgi:hypothetical protein